MHHCLKVLEIVDIICSHLDGVFGSLWDVQPATHKRDLAAVARTCTTFRDLALDHLWTSTTLLRLLTRCMPSDLWAVDTVEEQWMRKHTMRHLRPIYASDRDRLRLYAPRVKKLVSGWDAWSLQKVFPSLSLSWPETLLQNLQALDWRNDEVDFQYIHLFLRPTLTRVLTRLPSKSAYSLLSTLTEKCPKLTNISLWADRFALRPVSRFILALQLVEILSVPCLEQDALEHLAELPTLRSLHLQSPPDITVSRRARTPTFPALHKLSISRSSVGFIIQLLRMFQNVPLETCYIIFLDFLTAPEIRSLLDALTASISPSTLTNFTVEFENDPLDEVNPAVHLVLPDTVRLLLSFGNLTHLSLASTLALFDFDDELVSQMAHAWPRIETLDLSASFPVHTPRTTPACLLSFARHCPRLFSLTMAFDGTAIPMTHPGTHAHQERLHRLTVENSPITNAFAMAQFISDEIPEDEEAIQRHRCWQEAKKLLPQILAVREEERMLAEARLSA
ncbi:hypothetical protein DFH06DRAFT_1385070 [Mycena polygramma]|nr:hypothetical protein DFH06DRAFT_1385070 [Mycena polygramma]